MEMSAAGDLGLVARPASRILPAPLALPTLRPYVELTRPRILALVVFTALPAVLWSAQARPSAIALLLLATLLIGAACDALNAVIERRSDAFMARTRMRPLPQGRIATSHALAFGLACAVLALALLGLAGLLAFAVGAATLVHYVLVYSLWLKRRTPLNIVIGGAAGAAAPLLADAVLRGSISNGSLALALIIFAWTPPHFWAIALYRKDEYRAAGIPMLPCVAGDEVTRRRMLGSALLLIPVSLAPVAAGVAGWPYAAVAIVLGAWFVRAIVRSMREPSIPADRRTFRVSVRYLALLVATLAVSAWVTR